MNKPNILVVEDEELMRSILRQLLECEGYHVLTADSAENALKFFPIVRDCRHFDRYKNGGHGRP